MSLVEIARYSDVYEADLAAAFLEAHEVRVCVTERHQTTIDPLMQRALGIRLLVASSQVETARSLLARVEAGEFTDADNDGDGIAPPTSATRIVGSVMALGAYATGGFWGSSLPRRFRTPAWQGMLLASILVLAVVGVALTIRGLALYPP
jgi:hypothetical protein